MPNVIEFVVIFLRLQVLILISSFPSEVPH